MHVQPLSVRAIHPSSPKAPPSQDFHSYTPFTSTACTYRVQRGLEFQDVLHCIPGVRQSPPELLLDLSEPFGANRTNHW